jgi:Zn-dependent protease
VKFSLRVHPLFWLFAFLIGFLNAPNFLSILIWVGVIFLSLVWHETGHALAGMLFKQKVVVQINFFGGVTSREGPRLSLGKEFFITLAGPLFGLSLCLIAFLLLKTAPAETLWRYTLQVAFTINLIWTLLNLIPVLPLDGGRLLSIIFEACLGVRGIRLALYIGVVVGILVALLGFVYNQFFIGVLFFLLTFESIRSLKMARMMRAQDRQEPLQALFEEAQSDCARSDWPSAIEKLVKVRDLAKGGVLYTAATETLATLLVRTLDKVQAYHLLQSIGKNLSEETLPLFHQLAYEMEDYPQVIAVGDRVFQIAPTAETALRNAASYAQLKAVVPAVGWIERALQEGVVDFNQALQDPHFDPIRKDPLFQSLLAI